MVPLKISIAMNTALAPSTSGQLRRSQSMSRPVPEMVNVSELEQRAARSCTGGQVHAVLEVAETIGMQGTGTLSQSTNRYSCHSPHRIRRGCV